MAKGKNFGVAATAFLLASGGASVFGQGTTTTGFLDVTSLSLTPTSGSLLWSGNWVESQSTSANANGIAAYGAGSAASGPANAESVAVPPAVGTTGLFALAVDQINNLPSGQVGATTADTTLSTTFTTSGSAQLSLAAALSSILNAQAGPSAAVLFSSDSLSILVDNVPLSAWSDSITAGPSQTSTDSEDPAMTGTVTLPDGTHTLAVQMITGQQVAVAAIPEPSTIILFGLPAVVLPFWVARQNRRASAATR